MPKRKQNNDSVTKVSLMLPSNTNKVLDIYCGVFRLTKNKVVATAIAEFIQKRSDEMSQELEKLCGSQKSLAKE